MYPLHVILPRMEKELEVEHIDTFPDVVEGVWYADEIMWAS